MTIYSGSIKIKKWKSTIDEDTIQAIADLIKSIIETTGVRCNIIVDEALSEGTNPGQMPQFIDIHNAKQVFTLLASTRTMNDDLWESRIHLVLANDGTYPDIFGCWGFMQELHYKGINIIDMLYISSGESYSYFNDRVGAIAYAGRFHNKPELHPKVTDREGIALAAAHEIGHCLGLWHYPKDTSIPVFMNIMDPIYDIDYDDAWSERSHFEEKTLCGDHDNGSGYPHSEESPNGYIWDGMNTRHIIGINRTALDEYKWPIEVRKGNFNVVNIRKEK